MSNFLDPLANAIERLERPRPLQHDKAAGSDFADTLARYAIPPFSPWPAATPMQGDNLRTSDSTLATRPADQRRDRRRSR